MSIYKNIKNVCLEKGISVHALEVMLEFPRSSICKWDKNTPGVDKVKAVAEALGKRVEDLVD